MIQAFINFQIAHEILCIGSRENSSWISLQERFLKKGNEQNRAWSSGLRVHLPFSWTIRFGLRLGKERRNNLVCKNLLSPENRVQNGYFFFKASWTEIALLTHMLNGYHTYNFWDIGIMGSRIWVELQYESSSYRTRKAYYTVFGK